MTNSPARPMPSRLMRVRHAVLALVLLGGFVASAAHAQNAVAVSDQTVRTNTGNISNQLGGSTRSGSSDTVNGHLKNIDTLGRVPSSALSTVATPDVDLDQISAPNTSTTSCNGLAQAQQQNCIDIINTKNAQFTYMKAMYDMALKRQATLNDLQAARRSLQPEDFGKMQDNTNQILTLIAQIQIDRQQMESVYNAYSARLEYLQNQQAQLAKSATEPSGDSIVSNIASQAIAGAVLQTALSVQSSGTTKPLSIENSNGW